MLDTALSRCRYLEWRQLTNFDSETVISEGRNSRCHRCSIEQRPFFPKNGRMLPRIGRRASVGRSAYVRAVVPPTPYPLPPPSRSLSFTVQFAQMRPACLNKCERDDGGTSLSRYSRVHLGMARARFHVGPRALEERGFPLLDGFSCKLRCFSQRGIAHVQLSVSNSRIDLSRMRGFTRTRQREIRATCCARLE